jgi:hypothetical protein
VQGRGRRGEGARRSRRRRGGRRRPGRRSRRRNSRIADASVSAWTAQKAQVSVQGLRGRLHLRAQPREDQVQGLRGITERGAHDDDDPFIVLTQGLRGHLHLRAQPTEEQMQGLRGRLHLRAQPRSKWALLWVRGFFGPKGAPPSASTTARGADARTAGAPLSASTTDAEAHARSVFRLRGRLHLRAQPFPQTRIKTLLATTPTPWLLGYTDSVLYTHVSVGYYTDSILHTHVSECLCVYASMSEVYQVGSEVGTVFDITSLA